MDYNANLLDWFSYVMLILGIGIISISLFWFEDLYFKYPSIQFDEKKVTYRKSMFTKKTFSWVEISEIKLVADHLNLELKNKENTDVALPLLLYSERKEMKEKLKSIAENNGISFSTYF